MQMMHKRNLYLNHPPSTSEHDIFGECTSPGISRPHLADFSFACVVPKCLRSIEFVTIALHLLNPSLICPHRCLYFHKYVNSTTSGEVWTYLSDN